MRKSWRTTALGVIAALIVLLTQAQAMLDDDPATGINWTAISAALTAVGLGFARDNNVTSEDAGAKKR